MPYPKVSNYSQIQTISAVVWRKVLLVFLMIFELGPYSEPLLIVLPSESIRCGVKAFFHPKNWLWSLGPKKREKSQRCFIFGLEKGPDGVDFSKCGSFLVWRKVLLVQTRAPWGLFSKSKIANFSVATSFWCELLSFVSPTEAVEGSHWHF